MNYQQLSDAEVLSLIQNKSSEERLITAEVIRLLREVDHRRLFAEVGYGSLFEYCVKELKYSEGSAYRRISAMKLLRELPEIDNKIERGELSLTSVATLQNFFRAEAKQTRSYTVEEKREVLKSIESKSRRETEETLLALSPTAMIPHERERALSSEQTEIRFVAGKGLLQKLEKLKNLMSHKDPDPTYAKLFEALADMALKKLDPALKVERAKRLTQSDFALEKALTQSDFTAEKPRVNARYIPAALRREVWKRDEGRCAFKNSATGRACESCYQLEIDHIEPLALGGESTLANLRLLCRAHNQHRALKTFGELRRRAPN